MYPDADYGSNPSDPVWTEIARLDERISWVHANVNQPLYDEIGGLHQNMEAVALNYGPDGVVARRVLESFERVRLEGEDSIYRQSNVLLRQLEETSTRTEEQITMGMQHTYEQMMHRMGIEAQCIRESLGENFVGGFDAQRLREHLLQNPQDFLTPALHDMVGQMVVQHCTHALNEFVAKLVTEIQVLTRDIKSLDATNTRQQGELARLGGEVAGLRQFAAAQTPQNVQMPEVRHQIDASLQEYARKTTLENALLKNRIGNLEGVLKSLVSDVQGVKFQQGNLASSVSGVLDQCHGLDRRVENSTTQGALAVGRVQGVGQAVESLQKQLTEVQRAAYTPSKIDLSSVLAPLVSPLSTHLDAHGGPGSSGPKWPKPL